MGLRCRSQKDGPGSQVTERHKVGEALEEQRLLGTQPALLCFLLEAAPWAGPPGQLEAQSSTDGTPMAFLVAETSRGTCVEEKKGWFVSVRYRLRRPRAFSEGLTESGDQDT